MYKQSAPIEIENIEIKVPIHLPKNIPDKINIGEPKPSRTTQIRENIKNRIKLIINLSPMPSSIFAWID